MANFHWFRSLQHIGNLVKQYAKPNCLVSPVNHSVSADYLIGNWHTHCCLDCTDTKNPGADSGIWFSSWGFVAVSPTLQGQIARPSLGTTQGAGFSFTKNGAIQRPTTHVILTAAGIHLRPPNLVRFPPRLCRINRGPQSRPAPFSTQSRGRVFWFSYLAFCRRALRRWSFVR